MPGMPEALERLITDPGFRASLQSDPDGALAGYDLTDEEREILTVHLDDGAGDSRRVEQRTSKSGMLAGVLDGMGAVEADALHPVETDARSGEADGMGTADARTSTDQPSGAQVVPSQTTVIVMGDSELDPDDLVQAPAEPDSAASEIKEEIAFAYKKVNFGQPDAEPHLSAASDVEEADYLTVTMEDAIVTSMDTNTADVEPAAGFDAKLEEPPDRPTSRG